MKFDPTAYGQQVASILALDGYGERLMPLTWTRCSSSEAAKKLKTSGADDLFPNARAPQAALSGLYLYFSCHDEAHEIAQSVKTPEGAYWHGIVHRQEPDAWNARYWFRQVGAHPVFPALARDVAEISKRYAGAPSPGRNWDPSAFVEICEQARRQPGAPIEQMALETQRAEWQLLFDYCARGGSAS
jgi:hypothetical protein